MDSAQAGNWSAGATWVGGVAPTSADPVTILHAVTLDTVQTRNAPTYVQGNGVLTLAANLTIQDATLYLQRNAGNTKCGELRSTGAVRTVFFDTLTFSGHSKIVVDGSPTARGVIAGQSGVNYLVFDSAVVHYSGSGEANINYCDISYLGAAALRSFNPSSRDDAAYEFVLKNSTMDTCGEIHSQAALDTNYNWNVDGLTMRNSVASSGYCYTVQSNGVTPIGLRKTKNCVFDIVWQLVGAKGFDISGTMCWARVEVAGTDTWATADGLLIRNPTVTQTFLGGSLTNSFVLADHNTADPHCVSAAYKDVDYDIIGNIFQYTGTGQDGEAIRLYPSGAGAHTINIRNNIVLPNAAGGPLGAMLFGYGRAGLTVTLRRNTFRSNAADAINVMESYPGHAGMYDRISSNLAWSPNAGDSVMIGDGGGGPTANLITAADHNGTWNPAADIYKPIDSCFATLPGTGDVTGNPQFVDSTRNMATWDASLGGPGTVANALAQLAKRNDAAGYNSAYNIAALIAYVRAGFTPQVSAYDGTGFGGEDIGAVDVVLPFTPVYIAATLIGGATLVASLISRSAPPTLRTVNGRVTRPDGTPWPNAKVIFALEGGSYTSGDQFPGASKSVETASDGTFSIQLWCNEEGTQSSKYRCRLPNGETFDFTLPPTPTGAADLSALRQAGPATTSPPSADLIVTGYWTFNRAGAPFKIGALSLNQKVVGLNADQLDGLDSTAFALAVHTHSAADIVSGILADARFPATLPAISGANLTALNASQLTSGTIPNARFPATLPALNASNLTNLNASALATGTITDARLSANVPLLNAVANAFTGNLSIGGTATITGDTVIGGATAVTRLTVVTTTNADPRGIMSAQYSTDAAAARIHFRKARGTEGAPTVIVSGDVLGRLRFSGYDGAAFQQMASIDVVSTGTVTAGRVPTYMTFSTATDAAPSVLTERLRLAADGTATFAGSGAFTGGTLYVGTGTQAGINWDGVSALNLQSGGSNRITITAAGNVRPAGTYDLGASNALWGNLFLNGEIDLGSDIYFTNNNHFIYSRNAAVTTYYRLIGLNPSDKVSVDPDGRGAVFGAGGAFVAQTSITRDASGTTSFVIDHSHATASAGLININRQGVNRWQIALGTSTNNEIQFIRNGSGTPALQIDSASNATFGGTLTVGNHVFATNSLTTNSKIVFDAGTAGAVIFGGTASVDIAVSSAARLLMAHTVTAGSSVGEIVFKNTLGTRGLNAAQTTAYRIAFIDASDHVNIDADARGMYVQTTKFVVTSAGIVSIGNGAPYLGTEIFNVVGGFSYFRNTTAGADVIVCIGDSGQLFTVKNNGVVIGLGARQNGDEWLFVTGKTTLKGGTVDNTANALLVTDNNNAAIATFRNDKLVTFGGLLVTVASGTGSAGLRLPHGAAPTSPVDGDMWTTTAGAFVRINGVTKTFTLT